jgi:hypothetical protein
MFTTFIGENSRCTREEKGFCGGNDMAGCLEFDRRIYEDWEWIDCLSSTSWCGCCYEVNSSFIPVME